MKDYPAYSQCAETFAELFCFYRYTWYEVCLETLYDETFQPNVYAGHLLKLARAVVADFPGEDLWLIFDTTNPDLSLV